ncbi:MAG TPA: hypothetical protein VEJ88_04915 [Dissulfurispiraceae bacterium]|nr:hypothetical protein [Dissulfurispiraceae bacterium]
MRTIEVKIYKGVIFAVLTIGLPAFIAGWLVAVNFSGLFEIGYKMAFCDIKSAIKESVKDRQQFFYINDIKFFPVKLVGNTDSTNIKVREENEDMGKRKYDDCPLISARN